MLQLNSESLSVCVCTHAQTLSVSANVVQAASRHIVGMLSLLTKTAFSNVCVQSLAKANRQRLAVLLGEVQSGKNSEDRYEAALRGESLGTHSRGTTVGAQSIRNRTEDKQR